MAAPGSAYPHRDVRTRRIRFSYPDGAAAGGRRQHYVRGDLE